MKLRFLTIPLAITLVAWLAPTLLGPGQPVVAHLTSPDLLIDVEKMPATSNTTSALHVAKGGSRTETTRFGHIYLPIDLKPSDDRNPGVKTNAANPCAFNLPGGMCVYHGDLHSHTSYSDGEGTPAEAYAMAYANGLDFLAITDHAFMLEDNEWQDLLTQAQTATVENEFVGLVGYEWTSAIGHIDVFNSESIVKATDPDYNTLTELYGWLSEPGQVNALAQFNHPYRPLDAFDSMELDPLADLHISLIELQDGQILREEVYNDALSAGWHVAPSGNSDTHRANWGGHKQRTGIIAPSLNYFNVINALRARRTFASLDRNMVLAMRANGHWMGSVIDGTPIQFDVYAFDPDSDEPITTLEFYENGDLLKSTVINTNPFTWSFLLTTSPAPGTWWYVKAKQNDNNVAFTSPIWMRQPQPYDIAIRDNMWDLGNVPSADPSWQSPDIWIRRQADGQIWHQNPLAGETNYVYARVQNIGANPLTDALAYFYWAPPSLALLWPADWTPINLLPAHIPDLAPGETATVSVPWNVSTAAPEHVSLLVNLVSAQDPIRYLGNAKWDNNIGLKNVQIVEMTENPPAPSALFADKLMFRMANPSADGKSVDVHLYSQDFPAEGSLTINLEPGLFDRWTTSEAGGVVRGALVDPISKTIDITIPVNAIVYGLPLQVGEISTATLALNAPVTSTFAVHLSERIGAEEVGGNLYTTSTSETPRKIELQAATGSVVISKTVDITAVVVGDGFIPVPDGTGVQLNTTLGSLDTNTPTTRNSVATATFTANSLPGIAIVRANADGAFTATTSINIFRTCWVRLNDDPTDYWTVQAAVDASNQPTDVVKVAGHCTVVNNRGDQAQVVHLDKTITVQGGYTVTNWMVSKPILNPTNLDAEGAGRVLYISGNISPTIDGLRISAGNAQGLGGGPTGSDAGGGIYVISATPVLKNNWIVSNTADVGGGIFVASSDAMLINNMVTDNQATDTGDGLYIQGSSAQLWHSTIARNGLGNIAAASPDQGASTAAASNGTGIFVTNQGTDYSTVVLTNTILVSHAVGLNVTTGNTTTLEATLWGTATWSNTEDWLGPGHISIGAINIWDDPAFSCPARSRICTNNLEMQDYHVGLSSAALDAGLDIGVLDDIDGDPRADGQPDIGADELLSRLAVTKYANPDRVAAGEQLLYTIRITNTGDTALDATVTDTLPAHIMPGGQAGGTVIVPEGTLTWTPAITTPWGVWIQMIGVTVEPDYIGPLTNVVKVTTAEGPTDIYTATSSAYVKHSVYLPISMLDFPEPFCAPKLVTWIPAGRQAFQVALDTAGRRAFVAHADGVTVINTESFTIITTTQSPGSTHGIAYDPNHDRIWATRKEVNRVVVLDGASYETIATLSTGAEPHSVAYNPTNDRVYVTNFQGWSVTVYDAETLEKTAVLTDFAEPAHLAVNPATNTIYVANHWAGNHVTVINGGSHSTRRIPTALIDAYGIAVDVSRNLIYATAIAQGRMSIIDGNTNTELGYVDIKRSNDKKVPLRVIATNPDMGTKGHLWLVTSSEDGGRDQLLLIPNGWPKLGKPVPLRVSSYPLEGIAIQSDRDRVWVTSVESGVVSVVQDGEPACATSFSIQREDTEPYFFQATTNP